MEGKPKEQVWGDNVEAPARAKTLRGEDTLTLAQHILLNQERERVGNCEEPRLIFNCYVTKRQFQQNLFRMRLFCTRYSKGGLLWKKILQHSTITAIFATDSSNPSTCSVIFDSTATKQIYKTRGARFAKDFDRVTYKYWLQAKGATKQLLETVESNPLIPDEELALYFRWFGVVKKVVGKF